MTVPGAVRVTLIILVVLAVLVFALWMFQRRLIYFPDRGPVPPAGQTIPGARDVRLQTADGLELGAWHVPARAPGPGITVLVAPGNAGDRSLRAPLADALAAKGLSVLLLDYRGFGDNPGSPTEEGLALDARAAMRYLTERAGTPRECLLYFGESLGAAVVTELATAHPPAGLVLRSPFVDLAAVGQEHYPLLPVRLLLRDRYPLADNLARVEVPTTVVYGSQDSIVPPEQSRRVARQAPRLAEIVEIDRVDHNDHQLVAGARLVAAVVDLAERVSSDLGGQSGSRCEGTR